MFILLLLFAAFAAPARADDDAARLGVLRDRASEAVKHGDISAARRLLEPLAEAGDAPAARSLAEIYDPAWLARHNVRNLGSLADPERSLSWYKRASELGDTTPGNRYRAE